MALVLERDSEITVDGTINQWGNSLAVRLGKAVSQLAGAENGAPVLVTAKPGEIVIKVGSRKPTLDELLAKFDPKKHGGEEMAFRPVGNEAR